MRGLTTICILSIDTVFPSYKTTLEKENLALLESVCVCVGGGGGGGGTGGGGALVTGL